MFDQAQPLTASGLLKLQSWLSPSFPTGAYSYSHALEWVVDAGQICDRESLVDWLSADLCHGSGRNEAILFAVAWRRSVEDDHAGLFEIAELAAALRGTSELALESSQPAGACLATLQRVWPDQFLDSLAHTLRERDVSPALAVVLATRAASSHIPLTLALPAFLQSYVANWVTAAVRLIPLGQTDGQLAIAALEPVVLAASARAQEVDLGALGSAAWMVDLASMAHETQYTRLFRS